MKRIELKELMCKVIKDCWDTYGKEEALKITEMLFDEIPLDDTKNTQEV